MFFFFLMIRRPPRSTQSRSSAASDVYKRQVSRSRSSFLRGSLQELCGVRLRPNWSSASCWRGDPPKPQLWGVSPPTRCTAPIWPQTDSTKLLKTTSQEGRAAPRDCLCLLYTSDDADDLLCVDL